MTKVTVVDSRMDLQCPDVGCILSAAEGKYKTELMDQVGALQVLNIHIQLHQLRQTQWVQGAQPLSDAGGPCKQEKVPRPTLNRNIPEDKYIKFTDFGRDTREV